MDLAWVRRLTVESAMGEQTVFACFHVHEIAIPEGATMLEWNEETEECEEVPDPDAGKTRTIKNCSFHPPIAFDPDDEIYARSGPTAEDAEFLGGSDLYEVKELSDVLLSLPVAKGVVRRVSRVGKTIDILTASAIHRTVKMVKRKHKAAGLLSKRGRVISAKNEQTLRDAQHDAESAAEKINAVLGQLGDAPDEDSKGTSSTGDGSKATSDDTDAPALYDERELARILSDFVQIGQSIKEDWL
jgi:hypothetical protein